MSDVLRCSRAPGDPNPRSEPPQGNKIDSCSWGDYIRLAPWSASGAPMALQHIAPRTVHLACSEMLVIRPASYETDRGYNVLQIWTRNLRDFIRGESSRAWKRTPCSANRTQLLWSIAPGNYWQYLARPSLSLIAILPSASVSINPCFLNITIVWLTRLRDAPTRSPISLWVKTMRICVTPSFRYPYFSANASNWRATRPCTSRVARAWIN